MTVSRSAGIGSTARCGHPLPIGAGHRCSHVRYAGVSLFERASLHEVSALGDSCGQPIMTSLPAVSELWGSGLAGVVLARRSTKT